SRVKRSSPRVVLALAAVILAGCLGTTTDSTAPVDIMSPGKWVPLAPMPTARQEVAVAELNGRVFVIGGFGSGGEAVPTVEVYDPASDRWETRSPLPAATHHAAAAGVGGRLYVGGGYPGGRTRAAPLRTGDDCSGGPPLPVARGGLAAAALGDRVYVFGGEAPLRIFSATEMYEVAGKRWIAKDPMRTPRHGIGAAVVGNRIYVPGGSTQPGYAATD